MEKEVNLNNNGTSRKVCFVAHTDLDGDMGQDVRVWLTEEEVERLYRASKRPILKSLLLSLAERL